jgi:hypothetical protein
LAPSKGRQPSSEKKPASPAQRSLSTEEIGQVAGDLWRALDTDGAQTLAAVKKAVDAPNDLLLAAIGWLAREDKLEFSGNSRSLKISLR